MAGAEKTFDQLWIKAHFEGAKLRDLSSRDSNSKSIQPKSDNHQHHRYSQSSYSETLSHKCYE